jgi:predicted nucleic acid-binding protein
VAAVLLFPDNTVLVNFALIDRMDLLERLVSGNGRWCATVAAECAASARRPELAAMRSARGIFGRPWFPDARELEDTRMLRDELAGPGENPHRHLGEAETIAIMLRRQVVGLFVTDDNDAVRLATRHHVRVVRTWDLLKVAAREEFVEPDTLWGYVEKLRLHHRGHPPGVTDRPTFDKWLTR